MIPLSYPVGIIEKQEKQEFFKKGNEVFYKFNGTFCGTPMEIVVSSYIWMDFYFGKVKLTGYPYIYTDENNKYVLAWYASSIELCDIDEPENNLVKINMRVSRVDPMTHARNATELLKFIGMQRTLDRGRVVLYCIAKGDIARRLNSLKAGDTLEGVGEFCMYHGYRNVVITEVTKPKEELK